MILRFIIIPQPHPHCLWWKCLLIPIRKIQLLWIQSWYPSWLWETTLTPSLLAIKSSSLRHCFTQVDVTCLAVTGIILYENFPGTDVHTLLPFNPNLHELLLILLNQGLLRGKSKEAIASEQFWAVSYFWHGVWKLLEAFPATLCLVAFFSWTFGALVTDWRGWPLGAQLPASFEVTKLRDMTCLPVGQGAMMEIHFPVSFYNKSLGYFASFIWSCVFLTCSLTVQTSVYSSLTRCTQHLFLFTLWLFWKLYEFWDLSKLLIFDRGIEYLGWTLRLCFWSVFGFSPGL